MPGASTGFVAEIGLARLDDPERLAGALANLYAMAGLMGDDPEQMHVVLVPQGTVDAQAIAAVREAAVSAGFKRISTATAEEPEQYRRQKELQPGLASTSPFLAADRVEPFAVEEQAKQAVFLVDASERAAKYLEVVGTGPHIRSN